MSPLLSVVVPIYQVEEYLAECLASLAAQTLRDLEVVMVDDGSPDGSAVIAKEFAADDRRFRLVQQSNQGLGAARNRGTALASGEYITFVDSDDALAPRAYELMVGTLAETGSDFVTGNVRRFDRTRSWQCPAQAVPLARTRLRTSAWETPTLLSDRIACNKVFRRSFWDGLSFPAGLYEDSPAIVRALVRARSVDALSDHVYFWRWRSGSITGRNVEPANLRARMETARLVRELLADEAPALLPAWDSFVFQNDFGVLLNAARRWDDPAEAVALGQDYLAATAAGTLAAVPAKRGLELRLLAAGRIAELSALETGQVPVARRGWRTPRWYVDHPAVAARDMDVTDELSVSASVDRLGWEGPVLRLTGHAGFRHPGVGRPRVGLVLHDRESGRRIPVQTVTTDAPAHAAANATGFAVAVDTGLLRSGDAWRRGDWELRLTVSVRGLSRTVGLDGPRSGGPLPARSAGRWTSLQPVVVDGGLLVQIRRDRAAATSCGAAGDSAFELRGRLRGHWAEPVVLRAVRDADGATVRAPVTLAGEGEFTALLALTDLPRGTLAPAADGSGWSLALTDATGRTAKLRSRCRPTGRIAADGLEFAVSATRHGNLRMVGRPPGLTVRQAAWTSTGTLLLSGDTAHRARPLLMRALRWRGEEELAAPIRWEGSRFAVEFEPPVLPGHWSFQADGPVDAGSAELPREWRVADGLRMAPNSYGFSSLQLQVSLL